MNRQCHGNKPKTKKRRTIIIATFLYSWEAPMWGMPKTGTGTIQVPK